MYYDYIVKNFIYKYMRIIGHKRIIEYFSRVLSRQKLSNVYLFTGPDMVGKTTVVNWIINQTNDEEINIESAHSDIYTIKLTDDRKEIGIDLIRDMRLNIYQRPTSFPYRFFVIYNADKVSTAGYNALLKTLEEAPPYAVVFLLAKNISGILDTIISRSQIVRFFKVDKDEIRKFLSDFYSEVDLDLISSLSFGLPGKAVRLAGDKEYLYQEVEKVKKGLEFFQMSSSEKILFIDRFIAQNKKDFNTLYKQTSDMINIWHLILKDVLLIKMEMSDRINYIKFKDDLYKIAGFIDKNRLIRDIRGLYTLKQNISQNLNIGLNFHNFVLQNI